MNYLLLQTNSLIILDDRAGDKVVWISRIQRVMSLVLRTIGVKHRSVILRPYDGYRCDPTLFGYGAA